MQVSDSTELSASGTPVPDAPRSHRKPGTIPVTVRLDPFRYDRLKRLVRRFSTTGQNIIQTALDRSMVSLERERERASQAESAGQSLLFAPAINIEASIARKPKQDSFAFVRPESPAAETRLILNKCAALDRGAGASVHEAVKPQCQTAGSLEMAAFSQSTAHKSWKVRADPLKTQ